MYGHTLTGQHAVVTGASRGIGRAVAQALVNAGAHVSLLARGAAGLHAAATAMGPNAQAHVCDITSRDAVQAMATTLLATSPAPTIVVNNAGVFPLASIREMEPADFEETIRANLIGPFFVLRAFLPHFAKQKSGHVVTIGSVADRSVYAGNGAYAASKFGQRAMHEVLRQEVQGTGVRATLISPGPTDTPIWDPIDPDNKPGFPKRAQMLRPEDVADAVLWAVTRPPHVNVEEVRLSST
jgi:NADP-dependent 3-hydroxy acid dehydrogenase YdfG